MSSRLASVRLGPALLVATALVLGLGALAGAAPHTKPMISTKINGRLCQTVGGGRFVPIPGFQGERIDRRLLTDIHWISKHYPIYITDGYSLDAIHARNGEHPIGLALDIVPNRERGGTWADITRLARWAEPVQDEPRAPFRWVGYDGDAGHGRGNHLHLSWSHSVTRPGVPAATVYTIRCPQPTGVPTEPPPTTPAPPPSGGTPTAGGRANSGGGGGGHHDGRTGGRRGGGSGDRHGGRRHGSRSGGGRGSRSDHSSGGVGGRPGGYFSGGLGKLGAIAAPVPERREFRR